MEYEPPGTTLLAVRILKGEETLLVEVVVVDANGPALFGLDLMDKESLTTCVVTNKLVKRIFKKSTSVI